MNRMIRPALVLALIALTLLGCARRAQMPPVNVGYQELRETFVGVDLSPLAGRCILLDPGHGGVFPGVIGRAGMSEADVNLGVALYLRGLLEAAGAEVHMTRTSDRDFVSPADSTLATDLAARVTMCDTLRPDVFLSLHHNSNAALDRDMNETQTYYPVGRDGADLDLARCIHRHLVRNLDIRPAKIMAGNFYVLRNAPLNVPAVLGEPSMLSNPLVEAKLMTAEKMELEAQAYFLGLVEFFEGGRPYFTNSESLHDGTMSCLFVPDVRKPESAPRLDPASIAATWNGRPIESWLGSDGSSVLVKPPLESGLLNITASNLAGRKASIDIVRNLCGSADEVVLVRWIVYQESGLIPPARSLTTWQESGPWLPTNFAGDPVLSHLIKDGVINSRLEPTAELPEEMQHPGGPDPFKIDPALQRSSVQSVISDGRVVLMHPGFRWVRLVSGSIDNGMNWGARLSKADTAFYKTVGQDFSTTPFIPVNRDLPLWLESPGHHPVLRAPDDAWQDSLTWRPIAPRLLGKTIILDPAGGGPDDQGLAPMGTPGRELNLRVAERLAALLRGAGAHPILTRTDAGWVPPEAKVLQTNREKGALFLTIARRTEGAGPKLFHHFGSTNGERWARLTASALTDSGADSVPVAPSYAYLLRHTAPPALLCELPMPTSEEAEDLARSPAAQQAEALALFRAVAAYFEGTADLPSGWDLASFMARHRTELPHPNDVDLVRVDGNWLWLPQVGGAPAALLPPTAGPRTLEVRSDDQWWLFEADPAADTLRRRLFGVGNQVLTPEQSEPPRPEVLDAPDGN